MMIGGEPEVVKHLDPILASLAPGVGDIPRTPGGKRPKAPLSRGICIAGQTAPATVKMVHNGIEYGIMAAYAEGPGVLRAANIGTHQHEVDAETTPLRNPEHYQYESISRTSQSCGDAAV